MFHDNELTFQPQFKYVKKNINNRLFTLRKLQRFINDKCILQIYKQTNLPIMDYAVFILLSLNRADRKELQILQNDVLRLCKNVRLRDRISTTVLHNKANLASREKRWTNQLKQLMYIHSRNADNRAERARIARANIKYMFKLPARTRVTSQTNISETHLILAYIIFVKDFIVQT